MFVSKESNRERNIDYLNELKHGDDYNKEHKSQGNKAEEASKHDDYRTEQENAEKDYEDKKESDEKSNDKKQKELVKDLEKEQKEDNKKHEYFVGYQTFQSIVPKPGENVYVSKINKPAKVKDDAGFIGKLLFQFNKDNTTGMAAQLAYYLLLSIFPALIFLLTIVPLFNVDQSQFTDLINEYAPSEISGMLTGILNDVLSSSSGGLLSIGLLLTLWSASNGMNQLMSAFNVAYDIEDNRNGIVSRLLSVLFTLILALGIVGTFVLMILGNQIGAFVFGSIGASGQFKFVWNLISNLLPVVLVFVSFLIVYIFAPNIKIKIKTVLPGTITATILFIVASVGFSFYVSNFSNYSATYGSIAGVIILIFWLYITSVILILGAQINAIKHKEYFDVNENGYKDKVEKA